MGLDMYLYRKTYVKNWDHDSTKWEVTVTKDNKPTHIDPEKITYITEEMGYWRKANSIHKWFVDNVQNGNDDCGEYYVSPEKMEELLSLCQAVLDNPKAAQSILPTTSGFFFGSTEYDEYYLGDIKRTADILVDALKCYEENQSSSYYYSSSW
ncbi:MAG: hypothetical protein EB127_13845 [Alphaproteobacteria bacterium]|nr:hypothetical protein [Alphaproteobacteria bacterium]